MGLVELNLDRPADCIEQSERALALNRNLASAHALVGFAKYCLGHFDEEKSHVREATRLSPNDA